MSGTIPTELEALELQPAVLTKGVSLEVAFAPPATLPVALRKGLTLDVEFVPTDAVPGLLARTIGGAAGPAGRYSIHSYGGAGTHTLVSFSKNFITAANTALTLPAAPDNGDDLLVVVTGAYTGCSVIGAGGNTVAGLSTLNIDITTNETSFWLLYHAATTNWIMTGLKT